LRIFGAGIMSSAGESIFALDSDSPNRIAFNLERVRENESSKLQSAYLLIAVTNGPASGPLSLKHGSTKPR
jgi:phenylalanine-4-hydroxylase